jgi:hypothetical protein
MLLRYLTSDVLSAKERQQQILYDEKHIHCVSNIYFLSIGNKTLKFVLYEVHGKNLMSYSIQINNGRGNNQFIDTTLI